MSLAEMHCAPCRDGEGTLSRDEARALMEALQGWKITENDRKISLRLTFPDFRTALGFVRQVAELAENEGHHPDIGFGWGYVECSLTTHSAGGLTRNDFILAAKIDVLAS